MSVQPHDARSRLVLPVAVVIVAVFVGSAIRAWLVGDVESFLIAAGPFTMLSGYLYGSSLIRRERAEP